MIRFAEIDALHIAEMLEAEAARDHYKGDMKSADLGRRFRATRRFYRHAMPEIEAAGRNEWGIDPYEADWLNIFTPIEAAVWHDIRMANAVMYPQFPVSRYFVDFGNPVAKVALECDGAAFHRDKDRDRERDAALNALGWKVYRLAGWECIQDFDEETMTPSRPRLLIDRLIESHGIGRGRP